MIFYNEDDYFEYCLLISEIRDEETQKNIIKLTKQEMIDLKLWDYFCELRFGRLVDDDYWPYEKFELSYNEALELNLID